VQGSAIGPLLFINDIANLLNDGNRVYKRYVDDLKLYSILETDGVISNLQDKLYN